MFEEQAPTWTPTEPLRFHFFNHLESSRDLRWGFMANLFQGFSSKMDVLKVPLRFNTESEKQNFLQIFSFSFLPLFLTQEANKPLVLISPCMDLTIFKHFPRRTILSGTIKPQSARRDVQVPDVSASLNPAGWSSATGGCHLSSHRDPYLASLLPSLWETTNSPVSKTPSLLPRHSARHQTACFFVFFSLPFPSPNHLDQA